MINSKNLIKKIREESDLTQNQLAEVLEVSKVLIAMIETGQKPVSKKLISKLAKKLNISEFSLGFSLFPKKEKDTNLSPIELKLLKVAGELQDQLIIRGARNLKKYAK